VDPASRALTLVSRTKPAFQFPKPVDRRLPKIVFTTDNN
jgi:hypothetical protein